MGNPSPRSASASTPELWPWTRAVEREHPEIAAAVRRFVPLDHPAGIRAAEFLKEEALPNDPSTRTHLLVRADRVEGFFALSNAVIQLSSADTDEVDVIARRELPATLLAWIGRHRNADIPGRDLVATAYGLAREAARNVGSVAFVLDPADERVEEMWLSEPYGFRRSLRRGRLWLPLEVAD
jgi:hypothetical protein